jgi:protein TonB
MLSGWTGHISFAISAIGHAIVFVAVALPGSEVVRAGGSSVTVMLVDGIGSMPRAEPVQKKTAPLKPVPSLPETQAETGNEETATETVKHASAIEGTDEGELELTGQGLSIGEFNEISAAIEAALIYPPLARKRRIEGTVVARFLVAPGGKPSEIVVTRSSGHDSLDRATLKAIERASPYPAHVRQVEVPVRFRLRK